MRNLSNLSFVYGAAYKFIPHGNAINIKEIKTGSINKTFLIKPVDALDFTPFILQRINNNVFSEPDDIISNYLLLEEEMAFKKAVDERSSYSFICIPKLMKSLSDEHIVFTNSGYWRAFQYINPSKTYRVVKHNALAFNALKALASFHFMTKDIDASSLISTISKFHETPYYFRQYNIALDVFRNTNKSININVARLINLIEVNKKEVFHLNKAIEDRLLLNKVIHGDPKISNFLFEITTYKVKAIIDLDTCSSGIILYDLADCIRSCCNPIGEDTDDIESVYFDLELFENSLLGYFSLPNISLSNAEIFYLPYSIRTITFELSIRFLSDFFKGNIYFDVKDDLQNLRRAEIQFRLLKNMISKWDEIIKLTNKICKS